ncbi:MAG TPA: histidine kinase dimerization/phospho-acceptor domain-containing protein, partial [Burkholderiaceae bacterium]|nr:histidine kinase dimerization/phospho-acceptor domain-containing protein [Burkholderiaceae bacterium]
MTKVGQPESVELDESREVDRWMYQFTAQLAHDMRAPMGAIFMWAHVLRAADMGENRAAIDAIEASARQQSRMLADVVDMARALVGRLPVDKTGADLGVIVSSAVEEKSMDASSRRVMVDWPGPAATPVATVKADAKRLQQALGSLLAHA